QPTLEGWEIIDNTTADDWTNVRLAVVSGRPVSFISRLYEPKYVQRHTVDLAQDQPVAPVVYSGAMEPMPTPPPSQPMAAPMMRKQAIRSGAVDGFVQPEANERADALSNVAVNTLG